MKKKINVPFLTFVLINLLSITLLTDLFSIMFDKFIVCLLLGSLIEILLSIFITKNKINIINRYEKSDIICFVFLLMIMVITLPYPDRSFDSFNYHLFIQENTFVDKINYNFLPSSEIQTYTYGFSDRVFYIFRYFLGYRLGVMFNYFLLLIVYFESKDIINNILKSKNSLVKSLIALTTISTLSLIDLVDSYYIDLLSLSIIIILFKSVMYNKSENQISLEYLFYSLMFGFAFITKISNAFVLIILFIIYLYNNRVEFKKSLNLKNICILIFGLLVTITPYVLYTYIQTGNPVFPFYNSVFKSKYYTATDWMDKRFGPKNIVQTLLWPLYIMKNPVAAGDISVVEPIWAIGWITSIIYVLYSLLCTLKKKEYNKNYMILSIVHVVLMFVWSKFMLGYTRYGLITLVLSIISTYIFLYNVICSKKYILISIMLITLIWNYNYVFFNYFDAHKEWIYHNYYSYATGTAEYKRNLKKIFKRGKKVQLENNSMWGVVYSNSGLLSLLNPDLPIISISRGSATSESIDHKNNMISKYDHIYTAVDTIDVPNFFDQLSKSEYGIKELKYNMSYDLLKSENYRLFIFELSKDSKVKTYDQFYDKYLK